jgi:hypothetical protein
VNQSPVSLPLAAQPPRDRLLVLFICVAEPQANDLSHPLAAPTTSVLGFFLAMQLSRSVTKVGQDFDNWIEEACGNYEL